VTPKIGLSKVGADVLICKIKNGEWVENEGLEIIIFIGAYLQGVFKIFFRF